jgi:hypothetical protein
MLGLSVLLLGLLAYELWVVVPRMQPGSFGVDFHQYQDHARRWLDTGVFYLPAQLAGPYDVMELVPPLYPPPFLLVIIPFLWLPWFAWWLLPLIAIVWVVMHWRPAPWTWPLIAALAAWPRSFEIILFGNPSMWIAAFAALGTVWGWPAVAVLLKPSLAPFALIGVTRRTWWVALCVALAVSLPFATMWFDYVRAVLNAGQGWTYSLRDAAIVMIPVVAWLGRTRRPPVESLGGSGQLI